MALRSVILSGNARLEDVSSGGTPIRPAPPRDDLDAVRRIQKALAMLRIPMTKSFAAGSGGEPDGVYGEETRLGVIKFQQRVFPGQPGEWDGRMGRKTLEQLDGQLGSAPPEPRVIPNDPPAGRRFSFRPIAPPLVIKKSNDPTGSQDLESRPVQRPSAERKARSIAPLIESLAKSVLLGVLSTGGPNPIELGRFFFSNRQTPPGFIRQLGKGDFWSKRVAGDTSFVQNHAKLSAAIQQALQDLASRNSSNQVDVDVNQLSDGGNQPPALKDFPTDISFSFKKSPGRVTSRDPLAFGIGDIQGIEVRIAGFTGKPDGSYQGVLSYDLLDHFGSNDSDVVDPGQASLWLLQRKMYSSQDQAECMPYRLRITIDDVQFAGKLR